MGIGILPIGIVALIALTEVFLSLRLRQLPTLSVDELNSRKPELRTAGLATRSLPVVIFGLAILIVVARAGRLLSIDQAVTAMLVLLLLWMLISAVLELNFGLTYRLIRRRPLPGETAFKPEQYRLGAQVRQNGRIRLVVWVIGVILLSIALLR